MILRIKLSPFVFFSTLSKNRYIYNIYVNLLYIKKIAVTTDIKYLSRPYRIFLYFIKNELI